MKKLAVLMTLVMTAGLFVGCSQAKPAAAPEAESIPGTEETAGKEQADAPQETEETENTASDSPMAGMKIGATIVYKGDEWCYNLDQDLNELAKEYGATINVQDGNLDPEAQMKQIENFIAEEVDFLFVDPVSQDSLIPTLDKAKEAGIPVVLYDGFANWGGEITTVSWDNKETGTICGEYCRDYITKNLDGKANIVIITMAASERHQDRVDGFTEALEGLDGVNIISVQDGEGNRERSANVMSNIKDKVDIVFGADDNSAWGAITALEALNAKDTIVVSAGGYGAESFEALHEDHPYYKALVAVDPRLIAESVYDAAISYLKEESVDTSTNIYLEAVTKDNVENYWDFDS